MLELRWIERTKRALSAANIVTVVRVLQFRTQDEVGWSEWRDVPVVSEEEVQRDETLTR